MPLIISLFCPGQIEKIYLRVYNQSIIKNGIKMVFYQYTR